MTRLRSSRGGSALPALAALGFYVAGAVLLFGRGVVASPATKVVGDAGADKTIFMWSFRWWPHAIAHGHDPFAADVVWPLHGTDLAWAATAPLISLLAFPLTATAWAIATYNVAALAAPALSAWSAYLLARYVVGAFWPSVVAGWLFGFSAYEVGHLVGHLQLVFSVFIPLLALLVLKHLNRDLGETRFVVLLGLALAAEFLISTEMYLDVLLVGAIALVAAAWLIPELRRRLRVTAVGTAIATGCSLLLVSPYLWHAFVTAGVKSAPARAPFTESADLANYLVPTRRIWLQLPRSHEIAHRFTTTGAERGAYLGVPLTIIVLMFLWQNRRSRSAWAVACTLVAVIVASVGARVHVAGHATVPAPWRMFATLPVTKTVLPTRFTLFVILIVAVLVAKWLADGRGRRAWLRWALTAVAIIFVLPNPANGLWSATAPNPLFFKTTAYERHIPRGATVLVLPFGGAGWSLLWQAEDNFRYRLVDGHLGREVTPEEEPWRDVYFALGKGPTPPSVDQRLRAFLAAHHVAEIIVAAGAKPRVVKLVTEMGLTPTRAVDVAIYRLP